MLFETAAFSSGAFAIFKLAESSLKNRHTAGLLSIAYLLNPQLHFNDILGYHPDFLVLPGLLWGFYFLERGNQRIAILAFSLLIFAGEPWIPLCGFIGFSLVLKQRYWREGLLLNLISIGLFLFVFQYLLTLSNSENSAGELLATTGNFQIIYDPTIGNLIELFSDPRKWMYFIIILLPFLLSVFLSPIALFILLPEFSKSILSNEPLHYATEGHYTLAYIGVGFWALIKFIQRVEISSFRLQGCIPGIVLAMTLGLSIGHGALPHAYNFWAEISGGAFNSTKYTSFERASELHSALNEVDLRDWHSVETDNEAFMPKIGRRQNLSLFPSSSYQHVDFIISSKNSTQNGGSESGQQEYQDRVRATQIRLIQCFSVSSTDNFVIYRNLYRCDANEKPTAPTSQNEPSSL